MIFLDLAVHHIVRVTRFPPAKRDPASNNGNKNTTNNPVRIWRQYVPRTRLAKVSLRTATGITNLAVHAAAVFRTGNVDAVVKDCGAVIYNTAVFANKSKCTLAGETGVAVYTRAMLRACLPGAVRHFAVFANESKCTLAGETRVAVYTR